MYRIVLTQFPAHSCRIDVIIVKMSAGSARHGRQFQSPGLSLTLAVGADITHNILG